MNYTILWFDDEPKNISLIKKELTDHVKKTHAKDLLINEQKTFSEDDKFKELICDPDINLIITDLNLLGGKKGNTLIDLVRKHEIFVDILLYSGNTKQLIEATEKDNFLEGIYRFAFEGDLNALKIKAQNVIFQNIMKDNYSIRRYIHHMSNNTGV